MCMLHGVRLLQVEAMPTCGLLKSASSKPTARSMARLGVCLTPSNTSLEYGRTSTLRRVIERLRNDVSRKAGQLAIVRLRRARSRRGLLRLRARCMRSNCHAPPAISASGSSSAAGAGPACSVRARDTRRSSAAARPGRACRSASRAAPCSASPRRAARSRCGRASSRGCPPPCRRRAAATPGHSSSGTCSSDRRDQQHDGDDRDLAVQRAEREHAVPVEVTRPGLDGDRHHQDRQRRRHQHLRERRQRPARRRGRSTSSGVSDRMPAPNIDMRQLVARGRPGRARSSARMPARPKLAPSCTRARSACEQVGLAAHAEVAERKRAGDAAGRARRPCAIRHHGPSCPSSQPMPRPADGQRDRGVDRDAAGDPCAQPRRVIHAPEHRAHGLDAGPEQARRTRTARRTAPARARSSAPAPAPPTHAVIASSSGNRKAILRGPGRAARTPCWPGWTRPAPH